MELIAQDEQICLPNGRILTTYAIPEIMENGNILWPCYDIWQHRYGSTLAQVMAWCQTITWTNVDLSSKVFCGIHLRPISQEVQMNLIQNMCSEITPLILLPHLPGATELTCFCHTPWPSGQSVNSFVPRLVPHPSSRNPPQESWYWHCMTTSGIVLSSRSYCQGVRPRSALWITATTRSYNIRVCVRLSQAPRDLLDCHIR